MSLAVPITLLFALGAADLRRAGISVICLVLAITVHEFAHAFAADKLGDPTPKAQGRLTLSPAAHADPIGTLALPVILTLFSPGMLFGWGKPVQTEPRYYSRKWTMRGGMALVAFAGPLSNLALAAVTLAVTWGLGRTGLLHTGFDILSPIQVFFSLNVVLFAFNLIPLHPLDGGKLLAWALGAKHQHVDDFLSSYGPYILLVLVLALPQVLQVILGPVFALANWAFVAVV